MNFKSYKYSEINEIIFELINNKAAIIPTDTIIGIIARQSNLIYKIKNRARTKKIVHFICDVKKIGELNEYQRKFIDQFWPGPITIIKNNIAYRMPDDKYLLFLIRQFGELYCSSANISNKKPIMNVNDANTHFDIAKNYYDLIIIDEPCKNVQESTIIDIDSWKIIREGEKVDEVKNFISKNIDNSYSLILTEQKIPLSLRNKINFDVKISKLTTKNFIDGLNKIKNNAINSLIIITKTPDEWDMLANKQYHLRSGIVYDDKIANLIRLHDDAQVAIFDADLFNWKKIIQQINSYLDTSFEGGRHELRIKTIENFEDEDYFQNTRK